MLTQGARLPQKSHMYSTYQKLSRKADEKDEGQGEKRGSEGDPEDGRPTGKPKGTVSVGTVSVTPKATGNVSSLIRT